MPTSGSSTRPGPARGRAAIGWFLTTRYRCRGLRWVAAAGTAMCVLIVLGSSSPEPPEAGLGQSGTSSASRLPDGTRGVIVDATWDGFEAGDIVDVHAVSTGQRIVAEAKVTDATSGEAVIAIQPDQVPAVINAIATRGVTLVLAPPP